jgi:antitoxin component HigA of HigAB toxin-antitoxin module
MSDEAAAASTSTTDAGNTTADDQKQVAPADSANTTTEATKAPEPQLPERYEFSMPEGVELDKTAVDEFQTIAKELKLDQASAQKVADIGAKMAQRQTEAHAKLVESWVETVKTDKEIGGDAMDQNLAVARKALETFGTPELRDVLNSTGLGNHPEVIRAFYKAGKLISEDKFVAGAPKGAETDIAKKLFPSMN